MADTVEELVRQAEALENQGEPERAEGIWRKALQLCEARKDPPALAREICLSLADLNMQQGNMHGADMYYVRAMQYRKDEAVTGSP